MGIVIEESGVSFGEFEKENVFEIEKSKMYEQLGDGLKTVEFVLLHKENNIIFLEAKTGCPNPNNKVDNSSFDAFYDDIAQKMKDSLQVYLAGFCGKYADNSEIGSMLQKVTPLIDYNVTFVLVITADEIQEDWLNSPRLELESRLRNLIKIWKIKVVILNRHLAVEYGIVVENNQ